ncbi:hypothetical protein EQG49_13335 [Periweissella cryptocerci]|uniref:Uncharacterized protein n=1 Tax=Periweissella cryptocerci TaxID=2506420 RepID=A0A4P6YX02_9LACO|nr:hypothetical protein [Periweissella cryptocerci]QBO37380.1 hypothetical protein EQG49_13335 [Periweissella cryptocerci]
MYLDKKLRVSIATISALTIGSVVVPSVVSAEQVSQNSGNYQVGQVVSSDSDVIGSSHVTVLDTDKNAQFEGIVANNPILKQANKSDVPQGIQEIAANDDQTAYAATNELWDNLQVALNDLTASSSYSNSSDKAKANQIQSLLTKYDGAEVSYEFADNVGDTRVLTVEGFYEKITKGGVNDFASSKKALPKLRSYYGRIEIAGAEGVGLGAASGPIGALLLVSGSTVLIERANAAQSDIKAWIAKGSSKGGARITVTDEFPISSLKSIKQAKIKKL